MLLNIEQTAPDFSAKNQLGDVVRLSDYRGKTVVLYFYPKDDTPGCTLEGQQFSRYLNEFAELNTVIIGVSKDTCESHQAFIDKYALKVDLLADTTGELCERYGVWQERERNGVVSMAILRSTFIIDTKGVLANVEYGVTADGHALAVLEKVKGI